MQSSEKDHALYDQWLVHPALLTHPRPERVFIAGGGEGATLKEILRHRNVKQVTMVDIDQKLVEACKLHLHHWHEGSFDDPRATLIYGDARVHLEATKNRYDVIIIDISEPVGEGPAYLLYTKEFYELVYNCLTDDGVISLQAGSTAPGSLECLTAVYQTLYRVFDIVAPSDISIPSFGLPWGFIFASKERDPRHLCPSEVDRIMKERIGGTLKHYSGGTHKKQFFLTDEVWNELISGETIIEDKKPLFTYSK